MKVYHTFAFSLALGLAPVDQSDCPNDAWLFGTNSETGDTYCQPVDIAVTCSATEISIEFTHQHIYKDLASNKFQSASSSAFAKNDISLDCGKVMSDSSGAYSMTLPLDGCGTVVSQSDSTIVFSNIIQGSMDAIIESGIYMTKMLTFEVECKYDDTFELIVDDLAINMDDIDTSTTDGGTTVSGNSFDVLFDLKAFTDTELISEVTQTNRAMIGEPVFMHLTAESSLSSNLEYFLTDCTAKNQDETMNYEIIDEMCYSSLVNALNANPTASGGTSGIKFNFDAFSFDEAGSDIDIACIVRLCAMDSNGNKIDSGCAQKQACSSGYNK